MAWSASGTVSKARSTTKIKRVPSTLSSGDIRSTGLKYRDLAEGYLGSAPGLTSEESGLYRQQSAETIAGSGRGAKMRASSLTARKGYRGAVEQDAQARVDQQEMEQVRKSEIQLRLAEHTLRESDVVRRAAVGAGFMWPAEQARAAGQVSGTTRKSLSGSHSGTASGK